MKKYAFPCLMALGLLAASCHKTARTTSTSHFITATFGTTSYHSADTIYAGGFYGGAAKIECVHGDGFEMSFTRYPTATGMYPVSAAAGTYISYTTSGGTRMFMSVHGTLTITSVRPDLAGTFSFTASDSSIASGSFNVAGL